MIGTAACVTQGRAPHPRLVPLPPSVGRYGSSRASCSALCIWGDGAGGSQGVLAACLPSAPQPPALISGRLWSLPGIYLNRRDAPSSPAASTRLHHVQQKSNGVLPWFADPPLASSCSLVTSGRLGQATLLRPQGCWPLVELLLRTELDRGVVRLLRSGCLCGGRRVVNYMGSTGQGIVGNFRGCDPDRVLGALSTWAC